MKVNREYITEWFKDLQDNICNGLERMDGTGRFHQDLWERKGGGGGRTRVIEGAVIEKGGVNFSAVEGSLPESIQAALKLAKPDFYATGVSIVLHPHNPWMPIIHMNVRYFETGDGTYWFGGGIDLTPHYVIDKDAVFFHKTLEKACQVLDDRAYVEYKKWADDYFYVRHRKETRGIGGIFFDRLTGNEERSKDKIFEFVQAVGNAFVPIYDHMVAHNSEKAFTPANKEWQLLRRGRYVEFNLVWDRGTKFGLETDGRIESILMSLPPLVNWKYNHVPAENSEEARTLELLRKGIDWVGE